MKTVTTNSLMMGFSPRYILIIFNFRLLIIMAVSVSYYFHFGILKLWKSIIGRNGNKRRLRVSHKNLMFHEQVASSLLTYNYGNT